MISVIKNGIGITTHLFAILLLLTAPAARATPIVEDVQVNTSAAIGHLTVLGGADVDDIAVGTALSRELTDLILASRPEFTGVYQDLLDSGSDGSYVVGLSNIDLLNSWRFGTLVIYGGAGQLLVDEFTAIGDALSGQWIDPPAATLTQSQNYALFGGYLDPDGVFLGGASYDPNNYNGPGDVTVVLGTATVDFYTVSGTFQVDPGVSVPEPPVLLLIASGLLGLSLAARTKSVGID